MKDEDYFNDGLYVYTNDELKSVLLDYLKNKKPKGEIQTPLYMFVDEALRDKIKVLGLGFEKKPGKPMIVR